MTASRVGFITVNYRNATVTSAFVESVARLDGFDQCEVAIVDNAADGASRAALSALAGRHGDRLRLFHLDENRFYWPGAAYALRHLYPVPDLMPDWLIICNNDIEIVDRSFVARLLAYDPERYGVIAPSIRSRESGLDQNPLLRTELGPFERLKWKVYFTHYLAARTLLALHRLWTWARAGWGGARGNGAPRGVAGEERIYAPHGACVIFSRAFFRRGGYLDTNFALYGEEVTVGEVARRIGAAVVYCPELQVVHHEHLATGRRLTRALYRMEREAHLYFSRRYLSATEGRR